MLSVSLPRKKEDVEVPFFDFTTVATATNKFSQENVIGAGGFGPVYKRQRTALKENTHEAFQCSHFKYLASSSRQNEHDPVLQTGRRTRTTILAETSTKFTKIAQPKTHGNLNLYGCQTLNAPQPRATQRGKIENPRRCSEKRGRELRDIPGSENGTGTKWEGRYNVTELSSLLSHVREGQLTVYTQKRPKT
ncbi:g-type lectin s-receptor-like serine/threonine-protein kinase rks1 [Quercus suber]|uniref:G-type lectin s-receptor-like serine/threonine-protein kinase rks1 n=1 Tax=Quercus suber TaxID=58331 RepID=A0AAW0KR31_QUESU